VDHDRDPDPDGDLRLALRLADAADAVSLPRFRAADLRVTRKPDRTPVTDADTAAEDALRAMIEQERPGDTVLGEEGGGDVSAAGRGWVLDPIDGTKNFSRGVPVWATLIALRSGDDGAVGVVSAPALGRRWWAARGLGAWTRHAGSRARRCEVSKVGSLEDALVSYSSLTGWQERGQLDAFLDLSRRVWRTRAFGDFWSHLLVAEGAVDVSLEPEVNLWDLAALQPIVEEAGGRFTDLSGVDRADGGSVLCSNGFLHDEVLAAIGSSPPR
jgi:histidinol-phosphatase